MNAKDIRDYVTSDDKDFSELYDDTIDECNDTVKIGSLTYSPSQVLKEVDPTAYRCGFNDWLDSIPDPYECSECNSRYETEDEAEECCKELD